MGTGTGDDAGVYRIAEDRALIFTADFITPVVDDARAWGRVAATNAVSDVYAMGGRPLIALNLVGWNRDELPLELLSDVLAGASDVAEADGFLVVGGHTVDDLEPKYGLAVVGEAHPDRLLTNTGLRPGDELVLTKPLGIGVITTAIKRGQASDAMVAAAIASMTRSNAEAARLALDAGATGATDVTGFGLLGHAGRMAEESSVDLAIEVDAVPFLDGVRELVDAGVVPGGTHRNLRWVRERLDEGDTDVQTVTILGDAQTSGGLVFGVAAPAVDALLGALAASGHTAARIGRAEEGSGRLRLT